MVGNGREGKGRSERRERKKSMRQKTMDRGMGEQVGITKWEIERRRRRR